MDLYNRYGNDINAADSGCGYNAFVICASTGKAAVAVGGTTVHAAFKLTRSSKRDGGLSPKRTQHLPRGLPQLDCRLRQITQKLDHLFGGLDMILCGDLRQLPPVRASEIYKRCRETGGLFGMAIKWHYVDYFPLVRVVRQADATFSGLLTKIGDGRALDDNEVALLESRFVTAEEALMRAPAAVRLFYSNEHVDAFNTLVTNTYANDSDPEHRVIRVRARDIFLGYANEEAMLKAQAKVAKMSNAEFANLPRQILLVVDKPYMITANIDVIDGLVNGAVGTLKLCERSVDGAGGEEDFPRRLWLHFDGPATGKLARLRSTHAVSEASRLGYEVYAAWVPIEPRNATLTIDRKTGVACKRTQFPLVQASAVTVHKSQGGTYASIVYDYAKTHPQKLVYVAVSRCTNIQNLYLTNASADHRFHYKNNNIDKNMVDEFKRLDIHRLDTRFHLVPTHENLAVCVPYELVS
ncbi:hypothetical protein HPB49_006591 [Dermacentor silvarum]|uniref:Uncharacterized protein n=1 Tax=Dermacentor silvarum TaxID=543639 RepID=A0ACB8CDN4_DERSI|nr:hypothetical protein HPB49_006591 [Dermacentor silvarum]